MICRLQSEGNSCSQDPTAADIADDGVPGPSLQPCGSILIPEIDHNWQNRTVHDVLTRCRLMLNCVRFGNIAGQQRAIVAGQNGAVYVFEVPAPPSPGQAPPPVRLSIMQESGKAYRCFTVCHLC